MAYPALRDTMRQLVDLVREMIDDPLDADPKFSDEKIQFALDQRRTDAHYDFLDPIPRLYSGGSVAYLEYYARAPYWEGSASLIDSSGGTVIAAETNELRGWWRFDSTAEPSRPVRIRGAYYDVYGAAADLLEEWAAQVKACVDVDDGSQSLKLSQKFAHLVQLGRLYRARQTPASISIYRSDTNQL